MVLTICSGVFKFPSDIVLAQHPQTNPSFNAFAVSCIDLALNCFCLYISREATSARACGMSTTQRHILA